MTALGRKAESGFLGLAFFAALMSGCAEWGPHPKSLISPRLRVAVESFDNHSRLKVKGLGKDASDILISDLSSDARFSLVERQKLSQVFEEQKLGLTGAVDQKTAVKTGKIVGANVLITGAITDLSISDVGSDYLIAEKKTQTASARVDVRAVDAETGKIIYSGGGKGTARFSSGDLLGLGTQAGYQERLGSKALRKAVKSFADQLIEVLARQPWRCHVAAVSGKKVYLDAGRLSGLVIGEKLRVYRQGKEIKDASGAVIGHERTRVALIEIRDYFSDNGAVCRLVKGEDVRSGDLVKAIKD